MSCPEGRLTPISDVLGRDGDPARARLEEEKEKKEEEDEEEVE